MIGCKFLFSFIVWFLMRCRCWSVVGNWWLILKVLFCWCVFMVSWVILMVLFGECWSNWWVSLCLFLI